MVRPLLFAFVILIAARGTDAASPPDAGPGDSALAHIAALIDESAALSLPPRVERAFLLTLHAANDALRQGETSKARLLLRTFAFEVRGVKRARRLPADAADSLIARAESAIATCYRR